MAMVFSLVELAQTWISEHVQPNQDQADEGEDQGTEANVELEPEIFKPVLDAKASGGRWHFVIGLVVCEGCWKPCSICSNLVLPQQHVNDPSHSA